MRSVGFQQELKDLSSLAMAVGQIVTAGNPGDCVLAPAGLLQPQTAHGLIGMR